MCELSVCVWVGYVRVCVYVHKMQTLHPRVCVTHVFALVLAAGPAEA